MVVVGHGCAGGWKLKLVEQIVMDGLQPRLFRWDADAFKPGDSFSEIVEYAVELAELHNLNCYLKTAPESSP